MKKYSQVLLLGVAFFEWTDAGAQTFLPSSTSATVRVGEEVEIRLGVTELRRGEMVTSGRELSFQITGGPRHGQILRLTQMPRSGAKDAAVLLYRHDGQRGALRDVIRYSVIEDASGREVTSGTVLVQIATSHLELVGDSAIDFGNTALGDTQQYFITIRNTGTDTATGRINVTDPFILSVPTYNIPSGASRRFAVGFRPLRPGRWSAQISFSENPELLVPATGIGIGSLVVVSDDLFWAVALELEDRLPEREISVRLASGLGRDISLNIDGPLRAEPSQFYLPAGRSQIVRVGGAVPPVGTYNGTIKIDTGVETQQLDYTLIVLRRPLLVPSHSVISLRSPPPAHATKELMLCNTGEFPWIGTLSTEPPFRLSVGKVPFVVMPGEDYTVRVSLAPTEPGRFFQQIQSSAPMARAISLRADVMTLPVANQSRVSTVLSGTDTASLHSRVGRLLPIGASLIRHGGEYLVITEQMRVKNTQWQPRGDGQITIFWEDDNEKTINLQVRTIGLSQRKDGTVFSGWLPVHHGQISKDESRWTAHIWGLTPGLNYQFTIWRQLKDGGEEPASDPIQVTAPGLRYRSSNNFGLLIFFLILSILAAIILRFFKANQNRI